MTPSEFQLCTKVSTIYHCPDMNLLSKNLSTLCLYNLFSQSAANIEWTCNVGVKRMHSHSIQIVYLPVSDYVYGAHPTCA